MSESKREQTIAELRARAEAVEKDARLMQEINRAARDLPTGFVVAVHVERGSAWVTLETTEGERFPLPDAHYDYLASELTAAIDAVIAAVTRGGA